MPIWLYWRACGLMLALKADGLADHAVPSSGIHTRSMIQSTSPPLHG